MSAPQPADSPALTWALAYANAGWHVIPIRPGEKRPSLNAWTDHATLNPDTIRAWWTGLYAGHGIGLCPRGHYAIIDIDGDSHGVDGETSWQELHDTYNTHETETVEQITGGGGRHLIYRFSQPVRNGRLADGIDIRGVGGQILAEPTIHPNGQPYAWVDGASPIDREPADAPAWLNHLCTRTTQPDRPAPPPSPSTVGDRPGDILQARTSWADLLTPDGWTLSHTDHDGCEYWRRPGKPDGISATVNYKGADTLKVFTTNAPPLQADQTYTRLGYIATTRFGGDHSQAAQALRDAGYGDPLPTPIKLGDLIAHDRSPIATAGNDPADDGGWTILRGDNLTTILDGDYQRVQPTMWERVDGLNLLYPHRSTCIAAESGTGKSWLSCHAAAEQMMTGNTAMVIDFEDHVTTYLDRFKALGVPAETIGKHLIYVDPGTVAKGGHIDAKVLELAAECTIVVIDSVGEALAAAGVNENSDGEVGGWFHAVVRPLERAGCAVLLIDHLPKNQENQSWAIGSQRKAAALTGALYLARVSEPFSREKAGTVTLKVGKDRHGTFAKGEVVAVAHIDPSNNGAQITIELRPQGPTDDDGRQIPTRLMSRVSDYLLPRPAGASGREITGSVAGKAHFVREALNELVRLGHVTREGSGNQSKFVLVAPYSEPDEKARNDRANLSERSDCPVDIEGRDTPSRPASRPAEIGPDDPPSRPFASPSRPAENPTDTGDSGFASLRVPSRPEPLSPPPVSFASFASPPNEMGGRDAKGTGDHPNNINIDPDHDPRLI